MVAYKQEKDCVIFTVRVVPRASKTEVAGSHDGALKVRIAAPPVEGAANEELIKLLAKEFGVAKSEVEILKGHTSKLKQVRIQTVRNEKILAVLQAKK